MICYAFPLAHEAELVLKRCTQKESFAVDGLHCTLANFGRRRVLVARIGMGEAAASDNTETIFHYFRLKALVLAGYGGSLVPSLKVGQVVVSSNYTSEAVLGFLRMFSGFDFAGFTTVHEIVATPAMREAVAKEMEAQVADMETEPVAASVSRHNVPFLAVRAISDAHATLMPVEALAAGFNPALGKATPFRLLAHLVRKPSDIGPLRRFVRDLSVARRNLTRFLEQLNAELPASW
jgi:purine-nucleoside phosphorylase